jgi:hypothetical protein
MRRIIGLACAVALAASCQDGSRDAKRLEAAIDDPKGYAQRVDDECAHGRAASCTSVGLQMAYGTFGRTKDEAGAIPFLDKACRGGDARGCHELAVMVEHGRGVAADPARAKELHDKACAGGVKASCG